MLSYVLGKAADQEWVQKHPKVAGFLDNLASMRIEHIQTDRGCLPEVGETLSSAHVGVYGSGITGDVDGLSIYEEHLPIQMSESARRTQLAVLDRRKAAYQAVRDKLAPHLS